MVAQAKDAMGRAVSIANGAGMITERESIFAKKAEATHTWGGYAVT